MDLLPKDHKEFGNKDYWNEFFSKRQHFEWYGEYDNLCEVLDKYIHVKDKVLIVGCGNSKLSADLYDVGICNTVSIDISAPVINQMQERYGKDRSKMQFEVMDVMNMKYENETFAVVLDKGTLDALMFDDTQQTHEKIGKMFCEIERVLRNGGRYICLSLLQEHVLNKLLDWCVNKGWLLRLHRCLKAEVKHENSLSFPIFAVILTKLKKITGAPLVLEIVHDGNATPKRYSSKVDIFDYVKSVQHYAFLKYYLSKKKVIDDDICLELCSPDTDKIKYRMFVVDREGESSLKFAIFIVPQGREIEWLFSTPQGRQELAASADCERLVVVHLQRDHVYNSLDEVKSDLSEKVLELAPLSFKSQVPILSLGDDVGQREIKYKGTSELSGEFVVEDVQSDNNELYRRLVFLSNPYLVQSEAKLIMSTIKKKKKKVTNLQVDLDFLACDHHVAIISGFAFLESHMFNPRVLLIGLGGGALAMYLHKHFPNAFIEAVELDSCILEVAKKCFDLSTNEKLVVNIEDGINFIEEASKKGSKYDVVILDVDNKDSALGISSPPVTFLETTALHNISKITADAGIVIVNLACRNADLRKEAYAKLKSIFKFMYSRKIPAEVNEVVYLLNSSHSSENVKEQYSKLSSYLDESTKYPNVFDLTDFESCLNEIT
ncbi:eEF1A lysine and N-terminal methyltransferase [Parasteatoda tepidariorum]|uniref:eEF1A lysine and N-terminal methyltransferase n=1 Tax=Parasteatoda tepidariorum TaxID=114398 RepID=UPI001C71E4CF|nr:eEF1A lysine and N-terminal methyltransferase [Parasteatoda tepidariorum]